MPYPVSVFLDGQELVGWVSLSLSRSKDSLTGSLSLNMFYNYMPEQPVTVDVARGQEILVYIGDDIAFTGIIDKRNGQGSNSDSGGSGRSVSIGPDEYTVTITARGKTKYLVDSSHPKNTNLLSTNTREAMEALLEEQDIELDWMAQEVELDRVRFRDGTRIIDEIGRLTLENAHFAYETRDGKLRVTDDTGQVQGDPFILGRNILTFSAEQSETQAKAKIKVRGIRTKKGVWGADAILNSVTEIEGDITQSTIPLRVNHYGDATKENLERRARFEMNKRNSASKNVTIDVFHVVGETAPYDIGNLHYVEVPPEGLFTVMECVDLKYTVDASGTLKTTLTLAPPPSGVTGGGIGGLLGGLSSVAGNIDDIGSTRQGAANVTFTNGLYPSPWSSVSLSILEVPLIGAVIAGVGGLLSGLKKTKNDPPEKLPGIQNRESGR